MKKTRASDKVYDKIQEKIFSGEWKAGTKIMPELQMADEFKVSRVSVREAIEKLATLNIVIKKHGGGTYINDLKADLFLNNLIPMISLDANSYMSVLEFRLIMEAETAGLCAKRCAPELLIELEQCYEKMVEYQGDIEKFTEMDLEFHMKIAQGAGNLLIIKVEEVFRNILSYHQKISYKNLGPSGGIREHKFILDAIKNSDSELARLYSRRHIERTIRDLIESE
ncbi:FadR/GntR family transcriptional regulator [Clostridium sp. CF012]|uniref:FadR/GntR family transcriptional regulator n=1 Tax=Clostridium sp. CF012 TaxID=2843319 RepID=UPI001C0BA10C|nr:FadR/GntR family transcriptional regulator [Clostridium sp. CF012]MBU3145375.1 FadR family transcriptional regulator [Clostridium sp. CF012]